MSPVRLLVVDQHPLFRRGLVAQLAIDPALQVVGEADDAAEGVRMARALGPDVVLVDQHLPVATGIQAIPALKEAAPAARIVLLTAGQDEQDLHLALRSGADAYLLKTIEGEVLAASLHRVMRGESVISPQLLDKLVAMLQGTAPPGLVQPVKVAADAGSLLSVREQEVLRLIARGASNKEIARSLAIAETTVKIHVRHVLRKLRVSSRLQAAVAVTSGEIRL